MNYFTVFLVYILSIGMCYCKIQRVFFVENDFWCTDQEQLNINGKYLRRVRISTDCKSNYVDYYPETCYSLKSTNLGYIILENPVTEEITSITEDDNFFLRFSFLFGEKPNDYSSEDYNGKTHDFIAYKLLEKVPDNNNLIKFKYDRIDIRMESIKEMFNRILEMNPLEFNQYIMILGKIKKKDPSKLKDVIDFNLYFFNNSTKCFENLKKFIKELVYFKLMDEDLFEKYKDKLYKISIDKRTTLKVSDFRDRLYKLFFENLKKQNIDKFDESWELLLNDCYEYLESVIISNKVLFLIGGRYNIKWYIEKFANLIFKLTKEIRKKYGLAILKGESSISSEMTNLLRIDLKNLELRIIKDCCESEYVHNHFTELLGREVDTLADYIEVEKMVCDYFNMFAFVLNLYYGFESKDSGVSYSYVSPTFIDNYNLKIVDGIKIEFKFDKIRGFDDKEEEIILEKDTDYFIYNSMTYCPSKVLVMKNIQEIELFSSNNDEKTNKRFKVNEYLNFHHLMNKITRDLTTITI